MHSPRSCVGRLGNGAIQALQRNLLQALHSPLCQPFNHDDALLAIHQLETYSTHHISKCAAAQGEHSGLCSALSCRACMAPSACPFTIMVLPLAGNLQHTSHWQVCFCAMRALWALQHSVLQGLHAPSARPSTTMIRHPPATAYVTSASVLLCNASTLGCAGFA